MKFPFAALAALFAGASTALAAPDPNFHVFLCFGQSNMEGGGRIAEHERTVDPRFRVLADFDQPDRGRKIGEWSDAIPPLTRRTRGISLVDYFGRTMVANRDRRHFTPDGQREMGRRYAVKMLELMGHEAKVPAEPYVKVATGDAAANVSATKP